MTSRREVTTAFRRARFMLTWCILVTLGACASLPQDQPVFEQLDTDTGATVARLGRPVELFRETFQHDPAGRFAFLAPFETNQMGTRELFLWIAVPVEPVDAAQPPIVEVNGATLVLGEAGRDAEFAGLHKAPYKIPTPWSAMYYFKIDAALLTRLGAANDLAIRVMENTRKGPVKTVFTTKVGEDPRLREFSNR